MPRCEPSRPPENTTPIYCPACTHPLHLHTNVPAQPRCSAKECGCRWTPNDIAWWHIYGHLTPMPGPQHVVRKPTGAWE